MTEIEPSEKQVNDKKFNNKFIDVEDSSGKSSYILEYGSIWTNVNDANKTFKFNPEIFNHTTEEILYSLLSIIQKYVSTNSTNCFITPS